MIYYVIPAREGSKGFPHKNRYLFQYTVSSIPEKFWDNVIVTTDDEEIKQAAYNFKVIDRPGELSNDEASTKFVLLHVANDMNDDDIIVMLYLTYPQRTWEEIQCALGMFKTYKCKSLLCRKEVKTHPYLCIYESGKQVVKHDLYRRQDYPKVYEISHYIFIARVKELKNLNNNLYNIDTFYYEINDIIDVDYQGDLDEYRISHIDGR